MQDRLFSFLRFCFKRGQFFRVEIPFKVREVAAGDLNADPVTFLEHVRSEIDIEIDFIDLAFLHKDRIFEAVAVTHPVDRIADIHGFAVLIHVHDLDREVGIRSAGLDEQFRLDHAGNGQVFRPSCTGK